MTHDLEPNYQLDLVTPGMFPRRLCNRKQIRHMWKRRKNALTRPQRGQRLYRRTGNFGSAAALFRNAFLATPASVSIARTQRNGIPR